MSKTDIKKLRWLADRGVESEAYCLQSELSNAVHQLEASAEDLPSWSYMMQVAGQVEAFAKQLQFIQTLNKKKK